MHRFSNETTISAIATPLGDGAIAIIRLSGKDSFAIVNQIFTGNLFHYASHTAHCGKILDKKGDPIDTVLLLLMKHPHSYTGEDLVEIHCHGGRLLTRKIFERTLEAGAEAAQPGEFTLRAFLHGKLDLSQAEAVQTLISAQNEVSLRAASQQLQGVLAKKIQSFQKTLVDLSSLLEASLDFPEDDLEKEDLPKVIEKLDQLLCEMQSLVSTFHQGKIATEGFSLCIAGPPNVGKSSLLNAFLDKNRAITSPIPGTTRDLIEESLYLGSLHVRIMDTAGIRSTEEKIEQEGIEKTHMAMKEADLILLLLDTTQPIPTEIEQLLSSFDPKKILLVWNKIDLHPPPRQMQGEVAISAKEKIDLDKLKKVIEERIWNTPSISKEELLLTKERHFLALTHSMDHCFRAKEGLEKKLSYEFVLFDLKKGLEELGSILGINISEEILTSIFSQFCLGK